MFRFFENLVDPYEAYDPDDTPPNRVWPFLLSFARPFRKILVIAFVMSIIVAAIEIWLLGYLGRLVDVLMDVGPEYLVADHGLELVLIALFILLLRPVVQAIDVLILNNTILPNYGALIRWRTHRHVLRQSVGWFENDFAGRIANRVMQTPRSAGEVIFQIFDALTFAFAYAVGAAVLLADADVRLMWPLVIWFVLYGVLVFWTVRRVGPASMASSDARSRLTGLVVDSYSNIHSVKMFANTGVEIARARDSIEDTRRTFQKEMRIFTIMDLSLVVLNGLLILSVVGYGIWLWLEGAASIGVVAAAAALTLRLNAMTGWIMWALTDFFQNLGVIAEGMETIAQPIDLRDATDAVPLADPNGAVVFDQVVHQFGTARGGVNGITLNVAAGEKVGLVGRSGAGKSTLIKLLLRFYDRESGSIAISDQDIREVTQDSLRAAIGVVQQDSALLHRSILDNIRYGRPGASLAEVKQAARQAEAYEFIQDLADQNGRTGFDAHVGERGVKLSGGQRQRIVLARVILKNAPILVLDEATSALDSEVEAAIQDTLYSMMDGKTVIAIAHRLSTIAAMDRIVVMDEGKIIEEGTHDSLLAGGGIYASLWARQSGGFLDTGTQS